MSVKKFEDSEITRKAFLGKRAHELLSLSSEQVAIVYGQRGLIIPVEVSLTLQYLNRYGNVSLADISVALNLPHQLVSQRVAKLLKLGLVEKRADPDDLRRSELFLTDMGKHQADLLDQCMTDMSVIYDALYQEIGCDLPKVLGDAISALKQKSISERFSEAFAIDETG